MVYATLRQAGKDVELAIPPEALKALAAANTGLTVVDGRLVVERPNAKTIAAMEVARRGKLKTVGSVEELFTSLDADD
jgi:hypothetical protein